MGQSSYWYDPYISELLTLILPSGIKKDESCSQQTSYNKIMTYFAYAGPVGMLRHTDRKIKMRKS